MHLDDPVNGRDRPACSIAVSTDNTTHARAVLSGELDITGTGGLQTALDALRCGGFLHVEIDVDALDFVDAAALDALARAHSEFRAAGGGLVLTRVQARHRRLFELTGLDGVLPVE